MLAGWRYVIRQPRLRTMILLFYCMIMLGLSSTTAFPGLVENELGRRVEDIGVMSSVSAVGGLLASVFVAPIAGSRRALPVYAAGGVLTGLSLVLVGLTPTFLLVFGPMFLMGLGTGAFQTLNSAVIVTESEPQYYGRVISLTSMAFGAFMLASLPVGLAADAWGERGNADRDRNADHPLRRHPGADDCARTLGTRAGGRRGGRGRWGRRRVVAVDYPRSSRTRRVASTISSLLAA